MPRGREIPDEILAAVPGMDFAIDADFAHPAGDQLGVLRTEIQDEDFVGVNVLHGGFNQIRAMGKAERAPIGAGRAQRAYPAINPVE